jgi:hypothetical protein
MVTSFEWISSTTTSSSSSNNNNPKANNNNNNNNNDDSVVVVKEGVRFRETRILKGREFVMLKTVTRLQSDKDQEERYLSLGIAYSEGVSSSTSASTIENTSTLFVRTIPDTPHESLLILTIALGFGSWIDSINDLVCRYCIRTLVLRYNREEIEGYRDVAIQRYEALKAISQQ